MRTTGYRPGRWWLPAVLGVALVACGSDSATPATTATTVTPTTIPVTTVPSTTVPPTTGPPTTAAPTTAALTTVPATTAPATTSPPETMVVSAYFVRDEFVAVVHREVAHSVATLAAAIGELIAGPTSAESGIGLTTAVPSGTTLNHVSIADGIASIDLGRPFAGGGGTLSMNLRLAQLVYTATQFPTVSSVALLLDGEPVTTFGGEGIIIDHPLTRADFEEQTPAILAETPAPFDQVSFPLRIAGTSNVFEATFMIRIIDPSGAVIYEHFAMATSGTGTRGTFDVTIDATPGSHGTGTVRLWEPSSKDGSDTNVVEYPVEM